MFEVNSMSDDNRAVFVAKKRPAVQLGGGGRMANGLE